MPATCVLVDVFTANALEGNQLAVFLDGSTVDDALLQRVAREINFSETVYVSPPDDGAATARVRIFTPDHELPFAGHPTLGTAYVLAQRQGLSDVVLETKVGLVPVRFDASGRGTMTQPVPTVRRMGDDERAAVLAAIGVDRSLAPVDLYDNGVPHLYVVLESPDAVANLRPDLRAVEAAVGSAGVNCIAGGATVWKTRMFIPGAGVGEDPATGSAAGPLAVHAARHGLAPWGEELTISQGAEIGRPSTLYATAWGEGDRVDRVEVAGDCVIVGEATFTLPT